MDPMKEFVNPMRLYQSWVDTQTDMLYAKYRFQFHDEIEDFIFEFSQIGLVKKQRRVVEISIRILPLHIFSDENIPMIDLENHLERDIQLFKELFTQDRFLKYINRSIEWTQGD